MAVDMTPEQMIQDLNEQRRDADIIHAEGEAAKKVRRRAPGTMAARKAPTADTQLDTALLMMRLQLVQSHG